jgi:hypothetical protein
MGIADYHAYSGERGDLFRCPLRVASGYNDLCLGILAAHAADCGSCILIGGGRHRARIQYDDRCLSGTRGAL